MSQHDPLNSQSALPKTGCCSTTDSHAPVVVPAVVNTSDVHTHADACCSSEAISGKETNTDTATVPVDARSVRYRIDNMDCPTEERLIRNKLEVMSGIKRLDFNLLDRELTVYHQLDDDEAIAKALQAIDMAPKLLVTGVASTPVEPSLDSKKKILLAVSGVTAIGAEVLAWQSGQDTSWPVMAMAAVSIVSTGLPILKKGWIALSNLTLNIYFLMSLAVAGAVIIGKWPEAAMVIFLFAVAEAIEALSLERARNAIKALTALAPDTAEVQQGDSWQELPVAQVALNSRIRVRTGARVPLDARVDSGRAALNQAPITGESLPVDKQIGDALYAGSIVTDGIVEAIVTATASESTLARIAAAIQNAQSQRAPTQRFVDQFAHYYTPTVVVLAAAVAVFGALLFGGAWSRWVYEALVLLVIACPCALVISTPITVVSGLAAAAKHGILIKGGVYLESGRLLKVVALDKTGTLTQGKPILTDAIALTDIPLDEALLIAASLDGNSTHPVAKALVVGWKEKQPLVGCI